MGIIVEKELVFPCNQLYTFEIDDFAGYQLVFIDGGDIMFQFNLIPSDENTIYVRGK